VIVISPPLTLAIVGMLARRLSHGRLIYNLQELWPDVPRDLGVIRNRLVIGALQRMESWIYRTSERVAAIGPRFRDEVIQRGAAPERVAVIPNFVDSMAISPRPKDNALAAEWALVGTPVVLYAGNVGLTQDFDTVLSAAQLLESDGVHVLIVGGGSAWDGLSSQIASSAARNVMIRPYVDEARVADLYGLADVIVVPLKSGHDQTTTPSKVFSAMAAERPIVAAARPQTDLGQLIVGSRAGLLVPPEDATALAVATRRLLGPGGNRLWDKEAARQAALAHSPARVIAAYDSLLRQLAAT
jgi:colanic acid biosynthesis glycosyl transferase WcaI